MQQTLNKRRFGLSFRPKAIAAIVAGSLAVGVLVVLHQVYALSAALIFMIVGVLWGADVFKTGARTMESYTRWIPLAWLALFLVSNHSFQDRSPLEAAEGTASSRTLVELAVYGLILFVILLRWSLTRVALPSIGGWLLISAWPMFALFSTFWSVIPVFTLVRAAQLFIPIALAMYVSRLWKAWPHVGNEILLKTLRLLIRTTTVLTIIGFVFVSEWHAELDGAGRRFNWPGVHPVEGGTLIGLVLIVLIVSGRSLTNSSKLTHRARITLLSVALVLTQTRGALVGFAAAALAALWFSGRRQLLYRYLGLPLLVGGGWLLWTLSRNQLIEYSLRGGGTEGVTSFNGRIPLWELGIDLVLTAGRMLMGFGYGASRVVLFEKVSWAGTAHNAWIELFMGIGLIGVLLAVLSYVFLGSRLMSVLKAVPSRTNLSVLSLFVFLLTTSVIAEIAVLPGFGYALILFMSSMIIAESDSVAAPAASRPFVRVDRALTTT